MKYYSFVVKGNRQRALDAAFEHGVTVTGVHAESENTTTLLTEVWFLDKLVDWFVEPVPSHKGEGFPVGSLLLYSEHGESPCS